jgi:hypothetical protein
MPNLHSFNAWVTYLDIWGFSHEVERTPAEDLHQRLSSLVKECSDRLASDPSISPRTFFFSDSLFLAFDIPRCGGSLDAFEACRDRTQEAIQIYLAHDFLARGGIAYGEVAIAEGILVGLPVVRAAKCEQALTAPIVILPTHEMERCFRDESPIPKSNCPIVPTRNGGLVRAYLVHAMHIEDQILAVETRLEQYLVKGPELGATGLQLTLRLLKDRYNHG